MFSFEIERREIICFKQLKTIRFAAQIAEIISAIEIGNDRIIASAVSENVEIGVEIIKRRSQKRSVFKNGLLGKRDQITALFDVVSRGLRIEKIDVRKLGFLRKHREIKLQLIRFIDRIVKLREGSYALDLAKIRAFGQIGIFFAAKAIFERLQKK